MVRVVGAKNIKPLSSRAELSSTDKADIRHLASHVDSSPREQFKTLLSHQKNFLNWMDSRHNELIEAKRTLNPGGRGPKDAIYKKYRWYAQQQSLLEAINSFEAFYKNTFINLGSALQSYISPEKIKGTVDAKVLWSNQSQISASALIFEHQLFHNLTTIDDVTNMLVGARRYMPNNNNNPLKDRVKTIQVIFQIRHTLSHNQGKITQSDRAKFATLGYEVVLDEILDPSKDHLGDVVRDVLLLECNDFTEWVLEKAADHLLKANQESGAILHLATKESIEQLVGSHVALSRLSWS